MKEGLRLRSLHIRVNFNDSKTRSFDMSHRQNGASADFWWDTVCWTEAFKSINSKSKRLQDGWAATHYKNSLVQASHHPWFNFSTHNSATVLSVVTKAWKQDCVKSMQFHRTFGCLCFFLRGLSVSSTGRPERFEIVNTKIKVVVTIAGSMNTWGQGPDLEPWEAPLSASNSIGFPFSFKPMAFRAVIMCLAVSTVSLLLKPL